MSSQARHNTQKPTKDLKRETFNNRRGHGCRRLTMFVAALGLAKSAHEPIATPDDHIATDDYIWRETEKSLDEVEHVFQLEQAPPLASCLHKCTHVP